MPFWMAAAALVVAVALLILLALRRGGAVEAPSPDLAVYRSQLAEVERDLARGLLGPEEAARARTEISRRILEADAGPAPIGGAGHGWAAGALAVLLLGSAFLLYARLGAPGYPDLPLATRLEISEQARLARPSQAEMEAARPAPAAPAPLDPAYAELLDKLRATLRERPDDLAGQELLARNEAAVGNYVAAARAQQKVLALKGEAATAADHSAAAELLIAAAGGGVSAEAEAELRSALARDPHDAVALFYIGRLFDQIARPDLTFRAWRALLESNPADLPWLAQVREAMPRLAFLAGEDWAPPAPGPSAADVDAMSQLPPEERQAMIRGMVDSLSARMAREGGPPEDWARLITSLAVLGEADRARAIWAEAQSLFAAQPPALKTIRAAAERTGVAP